MITAGAEALSHLFESWDPLIYRIYYVLAAFQVSLMGAGALYLFANRNIINEQNTGKTLVLFSIIWVLFSLIFSQRDTIFLFILIPALLLLIFGFLIWYNSKSKIFNITLNQLTFSHIFLVFSFYTFLLMTFYAFSASLNIEYLSESGGQEVAGLAWQNNPLDDTEARAVVRLFSPLHTITGGLALIGGALYSYLAWQWAIKKNSGSFSIRTGFFNIYIALGALVLSAGGAMSGFRMETLYISEVISVTLMYFGFLESDSISMKKLLDVLTLGWLRKQETKLIIE
jgi:hypothetical protein